MNLKQKNKNKNEKQGYNYVFNQMLNKAKKQGKKIRKSRKSLRNNQMFPFLSEDGEKFLQDQMNISSSGLLSDPMHAYSQYLNPYLGNSLFSCCDTLFVFDNQKLYEMIAKENPSVTGNIPMTDVFQKAGN